MNSSATKKAAKKSNKKDVADLAPKKEQNVNGGFVAKMSKASPEL